MKKFLKFVCRKIKVIWNESLAFLIILLICLLFLALLALPGVIVAFLIFGTNPESLFIGGVVSLMAIGFVWMGISKVKELVKEYKHFNE